MTRVVADLFPLALGVAVSPLPIAATIVLLLSARAGTVGWAFSIGFAGGIAAASTAAVLLSATLPSASPAHGGVALPWVRVAAGALLLVLGVRRLVRHRDGVGAEATPRWLAALDRLSFRRAFGLGLLLSAANPKNLPIALAAGLTIAAAEQPPGGSAASLGLFVLAATSTVLGPVLAHRVAPDRVSGPFTWLRRGLARHGRTAATTVLLGVGALLLISGLNRF